MTPGDRVRQIRESIEMTRTVFAAHFGYPGYKIRDIESGKQKVTAGFAKDIERDFLISSEWILYGKEPRKVRVQGDEGTGARIEAADDARKKSLNRINYVLSRLGNDKEKRGIIKLLNLEDEYEKGGTYHVYAPLPDHEGLQWHSVLPIHKICLPEIYGKFFQLLKMEGRSMEPTICDNAIFSVDTNVKHVTSGSIYVFTMPKEGTIVRRMFFDTDKAILRADNKEFPDIEIPHIKFPRKGFLRGRVGWVLQDL